MGLLDPIKKILGMGGGSVNRNLVDVDPITSGEIERISSDVLNSSPEKYKEEAMKGIEASYRSPLQSAEDFKAQEESGLGMSPAFGEAIRQSYRQRAEDSLGAFKTQSDLTAQKQYSQDLSRISAFKRAKNNIAAQNLQRVLDVQMQNELARAQVIGSILQTGAFIGGMMAAQPSPKPYHGWGGDVPKNSEFGFVGGNEGFVNGSASISGTILNSGHNNYHLIEGMSDKDHFNNGYLNNRPGGGQ